MDPEYMQNINSTNYASRYSDADMNEYYHQEKNKIDKLNSGNSTEKYASWKFPIGDNQIYQIAQKWSLIYPTFGIDHYMPNFPIGTIMLRTGGDLRSITCLYSHGESTSKTITKINATMLENFNSENVESLFLLSFEENKQIKCNKLSELLIKLRDESIRKGQNEQIIGKVSEDRSVLFVDINEVIQELQRSDH